jgi:LPXTG-motif cell wall-anchored protein
MNQKFYNVFIVFILIMPLVTVQLPIDGHAEEFKVNEEQPNPKLGDSTPPVLESVEISANEVNVGDTITVETKITDDISGVDNAAISFNSPSQQRNQYIPLTENKNTGFWEGSYVVQKYDEAGEWNLWYLFVEDNVGNEKFYYQEDINSTLSFSLNNTTGDNISPTLETVKISSNEVSVGDTITVEAKITDDISGVGNAAISFTSPSQQRNQYIPLTENKKTGFWEGSYVVQEYDEAGEWNLWYLFVEDNVGNEKFYYQDDINSTLSFSLNNTTGDSNSPTLETVKIGSDEVSVGDTITVEARISDDISGVNNAAVSFTSPSQQRNQYIPLTENKKTGFWEGKYVVQEYDETGKWNLWYLFVEDKVGNEQFYYQDDIDSNFVFFVTSKEHGSSEKIDNHPKEKNSSESSTTVDSGDEKISESENNGGLPYQIVSSNETWSNKVIDNDVFIGPEAILSISDNVTVNGDIYVYGSLRSFGGLTINGTLHAQQVNFGTGGSLTQGSAHIGGSNSISSMQVSNQAYNVPLDVNYEIQEQNNNLIIQGKTLPFLNVYIDGEQAEVMDNGTFSKQLSAYNNIVPVRIIDVFGNDITRDLDLGLEEIIEEEKTEEIPFETIKQEDPTLEYGEEAVAQEGVPGKKVITYEVTYVNNEEVERTVISEEITVEPVNEIIKVGTKEVALNEENNSESQDNWISDNENSSDSEDNMTSVEENSSSSEDNVTFEEENNSDSEDNVTSDEENNSDSEDNVTSDEENNSDSEDNVASEEENNSDSEDNVASEEENNSDSEDNLTSEEENNSDSEDNMTSVEEDSSDSEDNVTSEEENNSDSEDNMTSVEEDSSGSEDNATSEEDSSGSEDNVASEEDSSGSEDNAASEEDSSDPEDNVTSEEENNSDSEDNMTSVEEDSSDSKDNSTSEGKNSSEPEENVTSEKENNFGSEGNVTSEEDSSGSENKLASEKENNSVSQDPAVTENKHSLKYVDSIGSDIDVNISDSGVGDTVRDDSDAASASISHKDVKNNNMDNELPNTATNTFNIAMIGMTLLLAGVSIVLYRRFKA